MIVQTMPGPIFSIRLLFVIILGDGKHDLHKQLCVAVEPTTVGGVLKDVRIQDSDLFYRHYLHDFVRLVHRKQHSKKKKNEIREYEVRSTMSWRCHSLYVM